MASIITNKGLELIATSLSVSNIKFIGFGTGTTAPAAGNTNLESASVEARTSGVQALTLTATANDTYRVTGTIVCTTAAKAVTEVALFDALTGGNMFARMTFAAINLEIGDSINFTIDNVVARPA